MDRYYLCPVIGRGTENEPFRAKVADANVKRVSAVIKSNSDGKPTFPWTIVRVDATNFSEVETMDGVTRLGTKTTLDTALSLAQKSAIKTKLRDVGEDLEGDTTPRTLITRLIKKHYAHVNDVGEAFP